MKDASWVVGHNEWAHKPTVLDAAAAKTISRKPDPKYNMTTLMRRRIAAHKTGGTDVPALDATDLANIAKAVRPQVDASVKFIVPRALGMAVLESANAVYGAADVAGWRGKGVAGQLGAVASMLMYGDAPGAADRGTHPYNLEEIRGQVLAIAGVAAAREAGLLAAIQGVAAAQGHAVDYDRIQAMIDDAVAPLLPPAPAPTARALPRTLEEGSQPYADEEPGSYRIETDTEEPK